MGCVRTLFNNLPHCWGLGRARRVLEDRIDWRTRERGVIAQCDEVVHSGANHFLDVYKSVYQTIKNTEDVHEHRVLAKWLREAGHASAAQQQTTNIAELYHDAVLSSRRFGEVVRGVAERCPVWKLEFTESKPKRTSRMLEKALLRRGEGRGSAERICDVVRCMIVVRKMQALQEVLKDFLQLHHAGVVVIVRVKDRFETPSGDSYRDRFHTSRSLDNLESLLWSLSFVPIARITHT